MPAADSSTYRIAGVILIPLCVLAMWTSWTGQYFGQSTARQNAAREELKVYIGALDRYRQDVGEFPRLNQGLDALRQNPGTSMWRGPYLQKEIEPDPWGTPFVYQLVEGGLPEVVSLGADGKPGGQGADMDISSSGLGDPASLSTPPKPPYLRVGIFLLALAVMIAYFFLLRFARAPSPPRRRRR